MNSQREGCCSHELLTLTSLAGAALYVSPCQIAVVHPSRTHGSATNILTRAGDVVMVRESPAMVLAQRHHVLTKAAIIGWKFDPVVASTDIGPVADAPGGSS